MRANRPRCISVRSLACLAALVASVPFSAQADSEIRYRFREGETTKYVMSQSMTMEMQLPMQPQKVTTRMQQKMYIELSTIGVEADGSARQRQSIQRITMEMSSEGGPGVQSFDYDSASDKVPEGPLASVMVKSIQPMVGAVWQQTISPRGEISNIEVPEKMVAALKANPGAAMMGNMATPEGLKQLSTQAAMTFPEEPLKVGDAWDNTIELKMPFGTMSTKKITKYAGPGENGLERMTLETAIDFQPAENSPAKLTVVDNESTGEILFDNVRGRVHSSELHQVTTMQIAAGGQNIDQTVTTDVLFQLDDESESKSERK